MIRIWTFCSQQGSRNCNWLIVLYNKLDNWWTQHVISKDQSYISTVLLHSTVLYPEDRERAVRELRARVEVLGEELEGLAESSIMQEEAFLVRQGGTCTSMSLYVT